MVLIHSYYVVTHAPFCMHVDCDMTELVPEETQEFEEVVKEFKEEVIIQEETQENPIDLFDSKPALGKLRRITHNF